MLGSWLPLGSAISGDASRSVWQIDSPGGQFLLILRRSADEWAEDGRLQDPVFDPRSVWGSDLSFNANGTLLAVGDMGASFPAPAGISEIPPVFDPPYSGEATYSGGVFIYQRHAVGSSVSWDFRSQVMASNPNENDGFGSAVSLSSTGNTLAVGAMAEDSAARGINGDQRDNSAPNAGAVYLY